jgi:DNA-binding MarR family transcriptional regulator
MHDGNAAIGGLKHKGGESHLLREIVRTHQVLMTGFSRKVGVPASRLALMRLIASADGDVGVTELARQLGTSVASVTRQVKEMEEDDLVRRRADPRDGRRCSVRLSPKGLRLFADVHNRGHELDRALFSVIAADQVVTAVDVLVKVRGFIEGLR